MACYRCGTPRYWEAGVLGQGVLGGWLVKVVALGEEVLVRRRASLGKEGVASAMGGMKIIGPTGRDQAYVTPW